MNRDIQVLRELARQYADIAAKPVQQDRRALWARHFSLKPTRPPILATYGQWNVWCRDVFGDARMQCTDPFFREHERTFRHAIFHDTISDDWIVEPWVKLGAAGSTRWGDVWGVPYTHSDLPGEGGAWAFDPAIRHWNDVAKLRATPHAVDEVATAQQRARLEDAVGDLLPVDVSRTPCYTGFMADISTCLGNLRGLEALMLDMYEHPAELHRLLAFMRDGILANNDTAERAGHYSLTSGQNQQLAYAEALEPPRPNSGPRQRRELWAFCAAQEFTSVSPAFHEEFLFRYQRPIYEKFGLVHYGCCEDLTGKISLLRQLPNLRSIAVTPRANVRRCAEQIGRDYAISWRPNPTDMVCAGWDEARIRRIIREGLEACRGQFVHIHLKDIETVQGDVTRLPRWVRIVREVIDECWQN